MCPAAADRAGGRSRPRPALLPLAPLLALLVLLPFEPRPLHAGAHVALLPLATAALLAVTAAPAERGRVPATLTAAVLLPAAWGLASAAWSVAPQRTVPAAVLQAALAGTALVLAHTASARQVRALAGGLLAAGMLACLWGTYEWWTATGPSLLPLSGPLLYKNAFAALLLGVAAVATGWAAQARGLGRGALLALGGWAAALLPWTQSRGVLYVALPAALVPLLYAPAPLRGRLARTAGIVLLIGALGAAGLWVTHPARRGGTDTGAGTGPATPAASEVAARLRLDAGSFSVQGRLSLWQAALAMAAGRPLTGYGLDTYAEVFPAHQRDGREFAQDAHNHYLQAAAELGLPGLLAWLGLLGTAAAIGLRALHRDGPEQPLLAGLLAAWLALAAHMAVDVDYQFPALALVFWLLLGMAGTCVREPGTAPRWLRPRAVLPAAAVLALLALAPAAGDRAYDAALAARAAGQAEEARRLLARAAWLGPWDPRPRYLLAADRVEQGLRAGDAAAVDAGLAALRRLTARHAFDDDLRRLVGTWLERAGRPEEAEQHLRAAVRLFPFSPFHRLALAEFLVRRGRPAEARAVLEPVQADPAAFLRPFRPEDRAGEAVEAARRLLAALGE